MAKFKVTQEGGYHYANGKELRDPNPEFEVEADGFYIESNGGVVFSVDGPERYESRNTLYLDSAIRIERVTEEEV